MVLIPGLIIALHELFVALNDLILAVVKILTFREVTDRLGTGVIQVLLIIPL